MRGAKSETRGRKKEQKVKLRGKRREEQKVKLGGGGGENSVKLNWGEWKTEKENLRGVERTAKREMRAVVSEKRKRKTQDPELEQSNIKSETGKSFKKLSQCNRFFYTKIHRKTHNCKMAGKKILSPRIHFIIFF